MSAGRDVAPTETRRPHPGWTFALVSLGLFMVVLDNLVVSTALAVIRVDLNASIEDLEWTVNAYTLTFAVLLLTGAALGDRYGRKRMFVVGLVIFTAASVAAALAPTVEALIVARAVQGLGGAIVMPLSLTLISEAFPSDKRGAALGAWSGIAGLGVALGPLVGGAVVEGISWQWIFWVNVPVGLVVIPLVALRLTESHGPSDRLDLPGLGLACAGLFGIVWGLVRGNGQGWGSGEIVFALTVGAILSAAFVAWERRAPAPMLPMRFYGVRAFSATQAVSLTMYFGLFGSVFLLAQYLQTALGYSPLEAGIRTLPWTGVPMFVAPIAGALSDKVGGRPLMATGLALQAGGFAWTAVTVATVPTQYSDLIPALVMLGIGQGLFFAPIANVVLSAVRPEEAGQASGANSAARELGGVFGVAVMATIFSAYGGYRSEQTFSDGLVPALWVAVGVVAVSVLIALMIPRLRPAKDRAAAVAAADTHA